MIWIGLPKPWELFCFHSHGMIQTQNEKGKPTILKIYIQLIFLKRFDLMSNEQCEIVEIQGWSEN